MTNFIDNRIRLLILLCINSLLIVSCKSQPGHAKLKESKQILEPAEKPRVTIHCTYTQYNTAMGKGRGMLFIVEMYKDTAGVEFPRIDSLVIGGKNLPFIVKTEQHLILEANYLQNETAPAVGEVTPAPAKDPFFDDKNFDPAWLMVTYKGKQQKLIIDYVYHKQY